MIEKRDLITILDTDINYFMGVAKFHRSLMTGLIATGIASLASLLVFIKAGSFPSDINIWEIVPFYSAILLVSYGLYSLFVWYDFKLLARRAIAAFDRRAAVSKNQRSPIDPFGLMNLFFLFVGGLAVVVSIVELFLIGGDYSKIFIVSGLVIVAALFVHSSMYKNEKGNRRIRISTILSYMDRESVYYPAVFFFIGLGFVILVFYPTSNWINNIIVSMYVVELEVVFLQGLRLYKAYTLNINMVNQMMDIRFNFIHDRLDQYEVLQKHYSIIQTAKSGKDYSPQEVDR